MGAECRLSESRQRRPESEVVMYMIHWSQILEVVNLT